MANLKSCQIQINSVDQIQINVHTKYKYKYEKDMYVIWIKRRIRLGPVFEIRERKETK